MENIKKFIPYIIIAILVITFAIYIPTIKKGQQLNKLQELSNVWNDCETRQLQAQAEAKKIREELGLSQPKPEAVLTGTIQPQNKAITLTGK